MRRSRHRSTERSPLRRRVAIFSTIPVAALAVTAALGTPPAQADRPGVTFTAGPTVTGDSVSLSYTINRKTNAIATRTCTVDNATTHVAVSCGTLPPKGTSPTGVTVNVGGLANGTYQFTVNVTLTDKGKATATSAPFTINASTVLTVDQAHLPAPGEEGAIDSGPYCEGSGQLGQSFTAGRTGSLGQVSLPAVAVGPGIDPVGSLSVDIYATGADGLPTGPSLGHGTYTGPDGDDDLVNVSLSEPAELTQGTVYALTWASTTDCDETAWRFFGGDGDAYLGGQAMSNDGSGWTLDAIVTEAPGPDFYFRTWMSG